MYAPLWHELQSVGAVLILPVLWQEAQFEAILACAPVSWKLVLLWLKVDGLQPGFVVWQLAQSVDIPKAL